MKSSGVLLDVLQSKDFRVEKGISSSVIAKDNDKFVAVLSTGTCPCQQMWGPGMDTLKYCANYFQTGKSYFIQRRNLLIYCNLKVHSLFSMQ